ncbi:Telomerase reverse transcriptase, partial [Linum grandiflorum]
FETTSFHILARCLFTVSVEEMAAKRKRKPRIPQVLWKLFEKRVRNLANTLVSLIPHPSSLSPPSCSCISSPPPSGCLRCTTGERAKLFLLRPDDPPDYRKLLTLCYVVVDVNAPPLRNFCTDNRWPQIEIVRRAIETVRYQQNRAAGNVMFIGYDQASLLPESFKPYYGAFGCQRVETSS